MEHQPLSIGLSTLNCIECRRQWILRTERWRAYVTEDDPPEVVIYCESCADKEFGQDA